MKKIHPGGFIPIVLALLVLSSSAVQPAVAASFTSTSSLLTPRSQQTATLLTNGAVLIAGGSATNAALSSAELYIPGATNTLAGATNTPTGPLNTGRYVHTATLLANGQVLVAGGYNSTYGFLASAELYDPAATNWTVTGSLQTPRTVHTATLLTNGMVLVAGGQGSSYAALASAELYNPATSAWTATSNIMTTPRYGHTATLLPNGKVLVTGGYNSGFLASAELYDPANRKWTATSAMTTARYGHTATLLTDGMVLIAGGLGSSYAPLCSAELYNPTNGTWTVISNGLATARYAHTATRLLNGQVLAVAGLSGYYPNFSSLSSVEVYDPVAGVWTTNGTLATARYDHTATLLTNGTVLVTGGISTGSTSLSSAELYYLSVIGPPQIAQQPLSLLVSLGSSNALSVTAIGTAPLSYQWQENGTNLVDGGDVTGSATNILTFTNLPQSDMAKYAVVITNVFGSVTSSVVTMMTVTNPPQIVQQPLSLLAIPGSSNVLSVSAIGIAPLSYQWQKNGTNLVDRGNVMGSATPNLSLANLSQSDTANYDVVITNQFGSVTSSVATLTVTYAPQIVQQPLSLLACPGSSSVLSVTASGTAPLSYQWQKNGTNLVDGGNVTGSATTNLTLANLSPSDTANYAVVITNAFGSVASSNATLTVTTIPAQVALEITNGFIVGATVTDPGCGYTADSPTNVVFSGQAGTNATAYLQISNGQVTNVVVTSAGSGYPANTVAMLPPFYPTLSVVQFPTNTPPATAAPIVIDGFIVGATLTSTGSGGYTNTPDVSFSDVSGSGATGYAQMSAGSVANIVMTSAGSGYSSNAVINFSATATITAVFLSATNMVVGQNYQLQVANDMNSWTNFGAVFTATDSVWTSSSVWNVANASQMLYRLQMLP